MRSDLLSVIVPYFNEEKRLGRCIESIIKQTYYNLEIILIDNCSDDNSRMIAEEYAKRDNRLVLLDCNEKGICFARNKGLDYFNGEYVVFVDSDDCLPQDAVEVLYTEALKCGADFVAGGRYDCDENMTRKKKRELVPFTSKDPEKIHGYFLSKGMMSNHPWGKIYAKAVFAKVRFGNFEHYEDIATLPLILENVSSFCAISRPVYNYCIRNNSLSSTDNIDNQYLGFAARLKNQEFYEKKYPRIKSAASEATLNFAFFLMGKMYKNHAYGEKWDNVIRELKRVRTEKISLSFFTSIVLNCTLLSPHFAAFLFCLYSKMKKQTVRRLKQRD